MHVVAVLFTHPASYLPQEHFEWGADCFEDVPRRPGRGGYEDEEETSCD